MRLVIFDGSFATTAFIRRLIQGLVKSGHQVNVLGFNEKLHQRIDNVNYVPLGSNQNKLKFIKTSIYYLLKNFSIPNLKSLLSLDKKEIQAQNLRLALKGIQPDIIHLQWISNIGLFEEHLKSGKYNFILSQRGFQTNVRPFINKDNFDYLAHWLPYFKGFHSVSKAISEVGDKIYSSKDKIDQVVYTGLNLSQFTFQNELPENKCLKIISVGRPHWKKGYDLAIRAMSLLKEKKISFEYRIIGGKGEEELIYLIHELGLTDKVQLEGQMPQSKVFESMQEADVFLLPSLEEGIANVAVEAMALGTPVISTNCGGMEELITHDQEGWIVPIYSVDALANQLEYFRSLPKKQLENIKLAARKKVENQHNEMQMVEGMQKLYSYVLN